MGQLDQADIMNCLNDKNRDMRAIAMRWVFIPPSVLFVALGGCPMDTGSPQVGVSSVISISSTRGPSPLMISVSGAGSTSQNGEITAYAWNFAGQASADTVDASHLFIAPGRYLVTLTVTDSTDAQASSSTVVRVQGTETPTAVIVSDVNSGPAPLSVNFDGTQSSVSDDTITDYFWDFGDGTESRLSAPFHAYRRAGTFQVELRVLTGGGLEGIATTTIVVGTFGASLQFNGSQRATLPLTGSDPLTEFSLETWFNADTGGEVVSIGTDFKLEILPATDTIRVTIGGEAYEATLANLSGSWQHIAIAFSSGRESVIYHDGAPLATFESAESVTPADLIVGRGYRGNLAEIRIWSAERTAAQVSALMTSRVSGAEADLLGGWPLSEGAGQTLVNRVPSGSNGTLGNTDAAESADAAWSTDVPPLP